MKKNVLVLGAGRMGSVIAQDLADEFSVTAVDPNDGALRALVNAPIETAHMDALEALQSLGPFSDVIVGALPSHLGFRALERVIALGKPYVDISFMPENPLLLEEAARTAGVTAVVDAGLAPGLPNMAVGLANSKFESMTSIRYFVGGLPFDRHWPYEYSAPFSPADVIEEYTRPARMKIDGQLVTRPALSDAELMEVPGIGTVEAFNTDGLRTLLDTIDCPDMVEKTLRYPGHRAMMEVLRETGFFQAEHIDVKGTQVCPLDVTAQLLFPHWRIRDGERTWAYLKTVVCGKKADDQHAEYTLELLDEDDPKSGHSAMARTTGYPCAMVARFLARGLVTRTGVLPPERLSVDGVIEQIFAGLRTKGLDIRESWTSLP